MCYWLQQESYRCKSAPSAIVRAHFVINGLFITTLPTLPKSYKHNSHKKSWLYSDIPVESMKLIISFPSDIESAQVLEW